MRTSQTIKRNQAKPPKILHFGRSGWKVEGRSRDSYWVTRSDDGKTFYCACPASRKSLLCRHVQAVILHLAGEANMVEVSFWTKEDDAKAQHRRTLQLQARYKPFWLTYNYADEVPRTGDKIIKVTDDRWQEGIADAHYRARDGYRYRRLVRKTG